MIYQPTIFVVIFLSILTLVVPRKYFLFPYVLAACFVPTDQRFIIMGLDFTVLRILIVVGVLRILIYGEQRSIILNKFDLMIFVWAFCGAFIYIIQWMNTAAIINRSGVLFDIMGLYWLFRQKIQSWNDVKFIFSLLAFSALILAPFVAFEWITGRNPFVILGRVITNVRANRFRCQGPFPHSIMLGMFWAILMPIFVGLSMTEKKNILYWLAVAATVFMVMASASSSPILVLMVALCGLLVFSWRKYAGKMGVCLLVSLAALHIIMRAPVWHLLARINIVGGSTGWHRYYLIDKAIEHFDEWAIIGCRNTEHWGMGLGDITNQFIIQGVRGGLITLLFFITVIYLALKTLLYLSLSNKEHKDQFMIWCFFIAIICHCVAFLGVSYFGQITMQWYMMLAIIAMLTRYEQILKIAAPKDVPTNRSWAKP